MDFLGSLLRIFWEFLGGIFLEELFGKNFLEKKSQGGFFRRTIFGRINFGRNSLFTLLTAKVFEYEWNLCFCQDFGVMQGRKEGRM